MKRGTIRAFTLVEIMVVVVIIGLLAAVAVPAFQRIRTSSENARFINDLRVFRNALEQCVLETGDLDQGSDSGTLAGDLQGYVNEQKWLEGPSIGGQWDVEYDKSGVILAIGVHNPSVSEEQIEQIDAEFDDGNVNSGNLRYIASARYYWVLED